MQRPRGCVLLTRAMVSIAVLAALLALIRGAYSPPLYCEPTELLVISAAERNVADMIAHVRRLESPGVLAASSADPRLAALRKPLRAVAPDEILNASTGPAVSAYVITPADGTISVEGMAGSRDEASAIADATADAYVWEQGASRVVRVATGRAIPSRVVPRPLSEPWQVTLAVTAALLASSALLLLPLRPRAWIAMARRARDVRSPVAQLAMQGGIALAVVACILVIHDLILISSPDVYVLVSAVVGGAFTLGGMRRPWRSLAVLTLLLVALPGVSDRSAHDLFTGCLTLGWLLGALAGQILRWLRRERPVAAVVPVLDETERTMPQVGSDG